MDITEVVNDSLGNVLDSFYICQECQVVDRDEDRVVIGHPCPSCGKPSRAGRSYFGIQVFSLIDLMQEFYHAQHEKEFRFIGDHLDSVQNSRIAVVIFFVSLREVLLNHFIKRLMGAHELPEGVCERLLADNNSHSARMEELFTSLTGVRWKAAIAELDSQTEIDYKKIDSTIQRVVRARNTFLHEGYKIAVKARMAEDCMQSIWPLLNLNVALNNRFVCGVFQLEKKSL